MLLHHNHLHCVKQRTASALPPVDTYIFEQFSNYTHQLIDEMVELG